MADLSKVETLLFKARTTLHV